MKLNTDRAVVVSIYNNKGGVSKTTSCVNIAKVLAEKGYRVLTIDNDGQANLTCVLTGLNEDSLMNQTEYTIFDLITKDSVSIKDCIIKSKFEGIDIVPANDNHNDTPDAINNVEDNSRLLKYEIEDVLSDYDFILIDCAPTRDKNVFNGLFASRLLLTPLEPQLFSKIALNNLLKQVTKLNRRRKEDNKLLHYVFLSKVNTRRKKHNDSVKENLMKLLGNNFIDSPISLLSLYEKAFDKGVTAIDYTEDNRGKIEYTALTECILSKLQEDLR